MRKPRQIPRALRDAALTAAVLAAAVGLCALLAHFAEGDTYVGFLFVLAVAFISRWTEGYLWGIFSSFFGVVCVNYVFTYPYWEFNFTMTGYPLTFVTLLAVASMVSAMTTQIKRQERERLETEREAIRADLLRAMSHDIRTPLTSIVGNTAAVLEDQGTLSAEQKRSLLEDVNEDAQWLIRMVENILSITRVRGAGVLNTEAEVAEEVMGVAARKFAKRFPETRISVEAPDEVLLVPMDATLIEQVILNLMENAVIHGGATELALRIVRDGDAARFSVSDNGRGIPAEKLVTLFDATSPAVQRGGCDGKKNMGIGLSVCRTVVKAHGGAMSAENRAEGGVELRFTLPLKQIEEETGDETQG